MSKSTTKRTLPKFRKLTIEVEESVAASLDALVGTSARYQNAGDVAAESVTLYLDLLEELETDMAAFKQQRRRRVLKQSGVKAVK